ncbi:hypothetical protein N0V87_010677 [Didymella glomerata]|uniref:Uncharacterized protein n=1 Tax=Didymella glomerata TaxID=749621 RepID=A0A9W9BUG2_9PLEO|nr:hypothetical protein N0V87_010677 [Didymella glomerata]
MGRTNIHHAESLASRAGSSFEEIALIPHADKLIYIITDRLDQEQLDRFSGVIRECKTGSWIQKTEGSHQGFSYIQGDRSMAIPKINISSGMQRLGKERSLYTGIPQVHDRSSVDDGLQETELLYVLIVQGQTGDTTCKLVIETSLGKACSAMMYEALNGYSTVFTAAILRGSLEKLRDETYTLKAVRDSKMLRTINSNTRSPSIGFWC